MGRRDARLSADQYLGALDQPARRDILPLLLPVELRQQHERHRAHDQHVFRSRKARRGLAGSRPGADVEREKDDFNAIDPFRIDTPTAAPSSSSGPSGPGSSSASSIRKPASSSARMRRTSLWPAATGARSRPPRSLSMTGSSTSSSASTNAAKASPRPTTSASAAPIGSRAPIATGTARTWLDGGGSLMLATTGRFIGPGGQEAVKTSKGRLARLPLLRRRRRRRGEAGVFPARLDLGRLAGARPAAAIGRAGRLLRPS